MKFVKGHIPWHKGKKCPQISAIMKGRKVSDNAKKNMSLARIGKIPWNKGKKGVQIGCNKGKKFSEEIREKLRISHLGIPQSTISRIKRSLIMKERGIKPPVQYGEDNKSWKGGITPIVRKIRNSKQYSIWRNNVFLRDHYCCKECHKYGGQLNAHHIKSFSAILEKNNIKTLEQAFSCIELWDINNGDTLCEGCHKRTDNYAGKILSKELPAALC